MQKQTRAIRDEAQGENRERMFLQCPNDDCHSVAFFLNSFVVRKIIRARDPNGSFIFTTTTYLLEHTLLRLL